VDRLARDSAGNLYGTTGGGGIYWQFRGIVYKLGFGGAFRSIYITVRANLSGGVIVR
jgi:hypothetical protein